MILQKHLLAFSSATAILACLSQPAASAPWVRGFVVGTYEPAFLYGGRTGYARPGEIEPGSDCIHGNTIHFSNSEQILRALSLQPWRSPEEIHIVSTLPGLEQAKTPDQARFMIWDRAMSYRGWRHGIETYINPFAAQDPGQPEVVSRIGDGFNLDGKIGAHDFVSTDGEKGIDNALYRAWGCDAPWRGNGNATLDMRSNDKMQEGLYTMVIRISGKQDPMNDKDATLEIGYSPDKIVKDARGIVTTDFSYRIAKTAQYTKMKARVANGVVETEQVTELHAPRIAWFYDHAGDAEFHQGRIRLDIDADGTAKGLIGGYRNWSDIYAQNTFAQDGGQQGVREHEDGVALYYALKRNADGMRDSKTGQNMGISTAYRITAAAAYVVDARKQAEITVLAPEEQRREAYLRIVNNMKKATTTRIVQDVTPGTSEGAYPNMERAITDLPIADYLLKTLDRPHFDDAPGTQASK
ncbi:MAG: hypothetical protein NTX21_02635 [Alphaproteobacteria bacterium]|nr:hypothetical protein [Alphaproteobacteria bacterium]